uniref:Uncharacterized protein n=1 Tax=Arundo donax TaxID=35708 RepID=A0A0A9B9E9_ARUDO
MATADAAAGEWLPRSLSLVGRGHAVGVGAPDLLSLVDQGEAADTTRAGRCGGGRATQQAVPRRRGEASKASGTHGSSSGSTAGSSSGSGARAPCRQWRAISCGRRRPRCRLLQAAMRSMRDPAGSVGSMRAATSMRAGAATSMLATTASMQAAATLMRAPAAVGGLDAGGGEAGSMRMASGLRRAATQWNRWAGHRDIVMLADGVCGSHLGGGSPSPSWRRISAVGELLGATDGGLTGGESQGYSRLFT